MSARFHTAAVSLILLATASAQDVMPGEALSEVVQNALAFLQPASGAPERSLHWTGSFETAAGGMEKLKGGTFSLDLQPPSHFRLEVAAAGHRATFCQNGRVCWIHVPDKKLLIHGDPATPRFGSRPDSVSPVPLNVFRLPVSRMQLMFLPTLIAARSAVTGGGDATYTLTPAPAAAALDLPVKSPSLTVITKADPAKPVLLRYADEANSFILSLSPATPAGPLPETTWQPRPEADDRVETVAPSHLERFAKVTLDSLTSRIPPLPPATGERVLVASAGAGRLERHDGTRVLFLTGTPEEMGRQHGTLLKKEIRRVVDRILYGVGVGSSFEKGRWFFGEIEEAVRRTTPFVDPRHLAEMDAIAAAAGLEREEVRLANYFPELFHCSGFALLGKATAGERLYHGRVLDYLRGVGLEENAVVIVSRPDKGNAWVNISYAGFIGSVTAMNEKQLSIGEMGGGGEGKWDGKPMAQLVREVMEKCSTMDEAIDLMRRTPRTCEYYYVLADAKSQRACGIKATPDIFEVVGTGESHPELADPVADTVLLSAGSRYGELVKRVKAGFGQFDGPASLRLMTRPVCMSSNIHSVLFAPDTLDFWVANADSENVASETRFTAYNLRDLLKNPPAASKP
jgi:isopenicillin-N N-acyltransferase-like protein